jgi:Zn-dependent protease with chaperone function
LGAFQGEIPAMPLPARYRLGIALTSVVMVLLPLVYVTLIGVVASAMFWHAAHNTGLMSSAHGRGAFVMMMVYLAPLVAGSVLIAFMIKPLFSRHGDSRAKRSLTREGEPLLFAFIDRVCAAVGSPRPKRIDVDLEVNASAGFRNGWWSLMGDDLVLTIGLPLAAGLNMRQFGGVLAHEFGHFSQGAGMRMTYVTRSVSYWFQRVVYERDQWDNRLRRLAAGTDVRVGWVFYLAMFFVWLNRKILWCFMMAGNFVGGFMLREMEFDADRYEAHLGGSETFAQTARRLIVLNIAAQGAHADLGEFYRDGRLADNLPKLIVANIAQLPSDVQKKIDQMIAESETGLFDTHPADRHRIANAARQRAAGVFRVELPATALFANFDALAKAATWDFYCEIFGKKIAPSKLHPIDGLLKRQQREIEAGKALGRYFQDMVNILRPLPLPVWEPAPPRNLKAALQRIRELRRHMRDERKTYLDNYARYDQADTVCFEAEQALALLNAGLSFKRKMFSRPMSTSELAREARRVARADMGRLDNQLKADELLAGERLMLALQMLYAPQVARLLPNVDELIRQVEAVLPAMNLVGSRMREMDALRNHHATLGILLHALEGNEQNDSLITTIRASMRVCFGQIRQLLEGLDRVHSPLDHAQGKITLARHLLKELPSEDDLGALSEANQSLLGGLPSLYGRMLGRLAVVAEQDEQALKMPPLPEPEEKPEPTAA